MSVHLNRNYDECSKSYLIEQLESARERIAELEAELKSFRNERAMREAWAADALKKPIESYE